MTKKLTNKIIIITIIIFLVIILILLLSSLTSNNEKTNEPPVENNPKIELTEELKSNLDRKVQLMKYKDYCEIKSNSIIYSNGCLYQQEITTIEELSETYKLYTLILSLDNIMETKINYVVGDIKVEDITFRYTQQFSTKEISTEYEKLYGSSKDISYSSLNTITTFPYVRYDSSKEKIFYQTTGETTIDNSNEVIEFISDYEVDEKNAYIYVSTAFISPTGKGDFGVYADYNKTTLIDTEPSRSYNKEKTITEKNYQQFNTYKYTFTKDESTNNLIFKQVELVK